MKSLRSALPLLVLLIVLFFTRLAPPALGAGYSPETASVELHAHLFMKEGMPLFVRGEFFGELGASSWKDRFSSMATPELLRDSGIGVLVVSLYAHPLMVLDLRDSVRRQIKLANQLLRDHPEWVMPRDGAEALEAFRKGKRILILALEGAAGVLETDGDLREFIDREGIRIVTLLHLTDDRFGGVAFLRGLMSLASPWAWVRTLFDGPGPDGTRVNDRGLTQDGEGLAKKLMDRGVWIDLAHSSDLAQARLAELHAERGLPHLVTHTALRSHLGAERGISDAQLRALGSSGGALGLMPSPELYRATPGLKEGCTGGVHSLARQHAEAAAAAGPEAVSLGTDYTGGIPHLPPSPCPTGTTLDTEGFWNIGQAAEVWRSLQAAGAPVPQRLGSTAEKFLTTWARVGAKAQPPRD
ncbi:MAG: membrane dipeptidase [Bdellovibrionales bacterium]|nr:membrane dipeptidase [Bdellovibrionales bacterium]